MINADDYRAKAAHAREKASETQGVIREEWLKLARSYDDIADTIMRAKTLPDSPGSMRGWKNGTARP